MSPAIWLAVACLAGAAAVVVWPASRRRARRRVVTRPLAARPALPPISAVTRYALASPGKTMLATGFLGIGIGALAGGPVAALVLGVYGGLVARAAIRGQAARSASAQRSRALDGLAGLAADLRAGHPAPPLPAAGEGRTVPDGGPADQISALARAAAHLAERTGAPMAELIERIEADARAMDRALASAAAQAAGAKATAWLLAALPAGGIALGYAIGVDPMDVLLHTPLGAACALGAVVLQSAGLLWAERLASAPRGA